MCPQVQSSLNQAARSLLIHLALGRKCPPVSEGAIAALRQRSGGIFNNNIFRTIGLEQYVDMLRDVRSYKFDLAQSAPLHGGHRPSLRRHAMHMRSSFSDSTSTKAAEARNSSLQTTAIRVAMESKLACQMLTHSKNHAHTISRVSNARRYERT